MPQNKSDREKYDTAWKDMIEHWVQFFLELFFQNISVNIDFNRPIEILTNKLKTIVKDSKTKDRYADELIKVFLNDGHEMWIMVHIEVQNYEDKDFGKRMFSYYYRIFDKYDMDVISLAVLTDANKNFRPDKYERKFYGKGIEFDFWTAKLLDYSEDELRKSDNPFAMVALAHLAVMKAGKDDNKRLVTKIELTNLLMAKSFDDEIIQDILAFMDWIIRLPEDLEIKYKEETGETTMSYVTTWEEKGMQKGMQKGGIQKLYLVAKNMLQKNMDINLIAEITGLTKKQITDIKNGKTPTKVKL